MKDNLIKRGVVVLWILSGCLMKSMSANTSLFNNELYQLTMKDGLADNIVLSIFQDIDGFMWFGTRYGISRYDGNQIQNFNVKGGSLEVSKIRETSDGRLWFLSKGKLHCFDRKTEGFVPVVSNECTYYLKDLLIANDSVFWVLKDKELLCIKRSMKTENTFSIEEKVSNLISDNVLTNFCFSKDRKLLYLVTWNCRLIVFDVASGKVLYNQKLQLDSRAQATAIFSDNKEYVWISTLSGGVIRFHIPTRHVEQFVYKEGEEVVGLSHIDAYDIIGMNNGSYFSVTWNGFTFFHPDEKDASKLISQVYTNRSFPAYRSLETRMISSYFDPNGVLWMGTRGGGVLYVDFREQFFEKTSFQHHNEIRAQLSDDEHRIWLGTFHGGIMRSGTPYLNSTQLHFSTVYNDKNIPVSSATKDTDKNLWFGNSKGELIEYNWKGKSFTTYPLIVAGRRLEYDITSLLVDNRQRFWVGTNGGLFLFDRLTKAFKKVVLKLSQKEMPHSISAMDEDEEHCIWLGTDLGVFRLEGDDVNSLVVSKGYEERAGVDTRNVKALLASSDGSVYVGYGRGLGIIPPKEDRIVDYFTVKDGLCDDDISCVVEDADGCIWLGNLSGVSRYSRHQHLFYNYYISGSNRSGMLFGRTLFWGNNKSLTYFNPEKIFSYPKTDKVYFVGLEINNRPVHIREDVNGQIILHGNISYLDEIELKHGNRNFSLVFNNLSYSRETQKYAYRLYPYQREWTVTENKMVSYMNLPSDDYTFEVKPVYPDNVEGKVAAMRVKVLPHWSQTWYFRSLMILCFFGILNYMVRWWLRRQRRLERVLKLEHEIFVAHSERDKEKQIREERERFFTNAAHELRTPLTLILSPLQGVLKQMLPSDKLYESLAIMNKNCASLHKLVDRLLYVRKMETGMVKLHLSEWNIAEIVRQQAATFKQMAMMRNCEFVVQMEVERLNLWIDVEKIESVVSNLLSNAFKYTPQNGKVVLSLSSARLDGKGFAVISVKDNGIGIPEQEQKNIFNSFVTGGKVQQQATTSVGVGLYIVKCTMDMHYGRVVVESHVDEGSCFTLYIPEGNEHFVKDTCEYTDYQPFNEKTVGDIGYGTALEASDGEVEVIRTNEKKQTLLVIEDNEDMRKYVCSLFHGSYVVVEAVNGEEGIRIAQECAPHLIISDIMMPVMDGFECCRQLRKNLKTAHIPIIMLTAKAEDGDRIQGLQLGIDDYMMKPFNPDLLVERVKNLLFQRERLKSLYTKALMLKANPEGETEEKELFMQEVIHIIEENLSNESFSVPQLADRLNMSQPTLYRKIRQRTNLSILEVIRGVRMTKAAALILEKKYILADVASQVGFDSLAAFRKHFVEQFGVLPSKYGMENNEDMAEG